MDHGGAAKGAMIIRGREAPTEPAEPGVTRQVLGHDPLLMMVRVTFERGAVGYVHAHEFRLERDRLRQQLLERRRGLLSAGRCRRAQGHPRERRN